MSRHLVEHVVVDTTNSDAQFQSSVGICSGCIMELEDELGDVLKGLPYDLKSEPFSHIIVTVRVRLGTRKRGDVIEAINRIIDECDEVDEYE